MPRPGADGQSDEEAQGQPGATGGGQPNKGADGGTAGGIQVPDLESLDPTTRKIVEYEVQKRVKPFEADYRKKTAKLAEDRKKGETDLAVNERYKEWLSDPKVRHQVGVSFGIAELRNPEFEGQGHDTGSSAADGDEDLSQLSPAQYEKRILDKLEKRLAERDRVLESKVGGVTGRIHDQMREDAFERITGKYPEKDYPEVRMRKDEVLEYSRRHGVDVNDAFRVVIGPDIENKLMLQAQRAREEGVEHARRVSEPAPSGFSPQAIQKLGIKAASVEDAIRQLGEKGLLPDQQKTAGAGV